MAVLRSSPTRPGGMEMVKSWMPGFPLPAVDLKSLMLDDRVLIVIISCACAEVVILQHDDKTIHFIDTHRTDSHRCQSAGEDYDHR